MADFDVAHTVELLRTADRLLERPERLVVIGGMALALSHLEHHATADLDLLPPSRTLLDALERAKRTWHSDLPIQPVGSYFAPQDFEDRLEALHLEGLRHLQVFVPERHDLALMKLARGNEHDMQALEELHRAHPLDLQTLVGRFRETRVTGNRSDFELTLLAFIERVFGEHAAAALDGKL